MKSREQSPLEERANSISHGLGLIAALIGAPILILKAIGRGEIGFTIGTIVFSTAVILLYLTSSIYHALPDGKAKRVFLAIDHHAILFLIAGTYTPVTLGFLRGTWGWILFGLIWGLAIAGATLRIIHKKVHPIFYVGLYLIMGWLIIIAINPLIASVKAASLFWLLAGGLLYTVGVIFFIADSRIRYGHLIWHAFVMAGTACHYFAMLSYLARS